MSRREGETEYQWHKRQEGTNRLKSGSKLIRDREEQRERGLPHGKLDEEIDRRRREGHL